MEDALRLFDAPFLLHTPNNLEHFHRQDTVKFWILGSSLLQITGRDDQETLLKVQHYIAVTAPEKRYPCELGVRVLLSRVIFPECDAGWTLRKKELQLAVLRDEELALAKKKRKIEAGWQIEDDDAIDVKTMWSATTPAHIGTAVIKCMMAAIR